MLSWANLGEVQQGRSKGLLPLALVSGQLRLTSVERPIKSECCIWCHSSPGASRRSFCQGQTLALWSVPHARELTLPQVNSAGSRRDSDQSGAVTHPPAALQNTIGHTREPFQRENEVCRAMDHINKRAPRLERHTVPRQNVMDVSDLALRRTKSSQLRRCTLSGREANRNAFSGNS